MSDFEGRIGLADFLTNLRAELSEAQSAAAQDPLKLSVDEITLTLDVGYTLTKGGEAQAGLRAKFWVLEFGEASAKGNVSAEHARTQRLTLTLKPQVEQVVIDEQGHQTTITRSVDVAGSFAEGEERPVIPAPAGASVLSPEERTAPGMP